MLLVTRLCGVIVYFVVCRNICNFCYDLLLLYSMPKETGVATHLHLYSGICQTNWKNKRPAPKTLFRKHFIICTHTRSLNAPHLDFKQNKLIQNIICKKIWMEMQCMVWLNSCSIHIIYADDRPNIAESQQDRSGYVQIFVYSKYSDLDALPNMYSLNERSSDEL